MTGATEQTEDWVRRDLDGVPPELRAGVLEAKARLLHDLACRVQDMLNLCPVYWGDKPLIEAKRGIDKACNRARTVAERAMHGRRRP